MKSIARIRRSSIYLSAFIILSYFLILLIVGKIDFETDIGGLRSIAILLATISGILIGLVSVTATAIMQITLSQKQFYQNILANESEWLENWFVNHPTIYALLKDEEKEIINTIYQHSTIPRFSEEETREKLSKTMSHLADKWHKRVKESTDESHIKQGEINKFEKHLVGILTTLGQIGITKTKFEAGRDMSHVLWFLGYQLSISLIVILLCSIDNIATNMSDAASVWAVAIILSAIGLVFSLIYSVTSYMKIEVKFMTHTYRLRKEE